MQFIGISFQSETVNKTCNQLGSQNYYKTHNSTEDVNETSPLKDW